MSSDELGWSDEVAIQRLITGLEFYNNSQYYSFDFLGSAFLFIENWMKYVESKVCYIVKYEDLLTDKVATVHGIMDYISLSVTNVEIETALRDTDMFLRDGRKRGESEKGAHNRKGISGEWRLYFDERAKQICKERIGGLLIRLGYENDYEW